MANEMKRKRMFGGVGSLYNSRHSGTSESHPLEGRQVAIPIDFHRC